ncbi:MAG: hypothetical protein ABFC96_02165 [Thermoguttaceae bacterium]
MGASGVRLFDDDLAADVRDLFCEELKQGKTGPAASNALIGHFQEVLGAEEETVFWLALAYVQWEHGLLQRRILMKALAILDQGSDLDRWADDPRLQKKRANVLERVRQELQSPQTKPKIVRPRKRFPSKCEWQAGDIFSYKLDSGNFLLMRIVDVMDNAGEDRPLCELLDFFGTEVPEPEVIRGLPISRNKRYPSESIFSFPMLKKHLARCHSLGLNTSTVLRNDGGYILSIDFNRLSQELEGSFGMCVDES